MDEKGNISGYRRKLEKTLASPDLTNDEKLQTLVRNQVLQSSHDLHFEGDIENVVGRRSKEVSNFLSMLRSASSNDVKGSKSDEDSCGGWKVKQETEEFRVMYRGAEGTPFHTLLVEGYVDGPLDVCLCISWEAGLYNKWWPQTSFPTFKIISSQCLKRVRAGEQISLVRMKVSWPLSSREAVLHYFAFEYFQDDLMVVLFNSISDSETIDRRSHGFTREGIPNADEVVRVDVVGGFACQKVTANRCYFRVIASMDVKLELLPPSFINFMSRQILGSGFKLFKKEIASVSKGNESFREALTDPFYTGIRERLYSRSSAQDLDNNLERSTSVILEDQSERASEDDSDERTNCCDDKSALNSSHSNSSDQTTDKFRHNYKEVLFTSCSEMEELARTNNGTERYGFEVEKKVRISTEVKQALETLEKANSILQERRSNFGKCPSGINSANLTKGEWTTSEADQMSRNYAESQKLSSVQARTISSDNDVLRPKESVANQRKIAAEEYPPKSDASSSSMNQKTTNGKSVSRMKSNKSRFCCLRIISL